MEHFVTDILSCTERYGLEPSSLEFEITEKLIFEQSRKKHTALTELRDHGFRIAVDDFGTGYLSMNYLKNLPLDTIKIDKSFIEGLPDDKSDVAIIKAIMALTENLKYYVVAEGIENIDQEEFLLSISCKVGQGYLYSKPLSAEAFKQKLG